MKITNITEIDKNSYKMYLGKYILEFEHEVLISNVRLELNYKGDYYLKWPVRKGGNKFVGPLTSDFSRYCIAEVVKHYENQQQEVLPA